MNPDPNSDSPLLVVLLGASNLARGCFALSHCIRQRLRPRPVEVLCAPGPGRGYVSAAGLLNVVYPPILTSPIFDAAREKREAGYTVAALVTDIGNDLMYGVPVWELIDAVQQVFDKLRSMKAEVFFTTLPTAFEKDIHPLWFYCLRTMLIPRSRVGFQEAVAGITRMNDFLRQAAPEHGRLIEGMDRFLGFDDIHYGWFKSASAWTHVARTMTENLAPSSSAKITQGKMLRSYWEGVRRLAGSDMTGLKPLPAGYF